jgi:hypothetical protein
MEMVRMAAAVSSAAEAPEAAIMPILSPAARVLAEATGASEAEAARGFPKVVVQAAAEAVAIAAGLAGATMVAVAAPRISTRRSPIPVLPPAQTAATAM